MPLAGNETMTENLDIDEITALFTRGDGAYLSARWGRPIVPVVFGVTDETLAVVKAAIEAVVHLAGHKMAETDPELGANLMMFFIQDWVELQEFPNMDQLIPDLGPLCAKLGAGNANQYRAFRFDTDGAIKAAFVFVKMDAHLSTVPAADIALAQAVQVICLWSDRAFGARAPLALLDGVAVLRPDIAAVIRALYAPMMPIVARDPSHALRILARIP
jgi:hypothetical protein